MKLSDGEIAANKDITRMHQLKETIENVYRFNPQAKVASNILCYIAVVDL